MGYGIRLTYEERDAIDHVRLTSPSADVFRNCLIILRSDSKDTIAAIARQLGCSVETVKRVRRLYRMGGVNALYPIRPPGRPSRATARFRKLLGKVAETSPRKLGYGFSTWSAGRLAGHMAKVTGIAFSSHQIRRILHQQNYSFHRPKHTLKEQRDPAAYARAQRRLTRLKKGRYSLGPANP
jgi:transposase